MRRQAKKLGLPMVLQPPYFPVNPAPASYAIIAATKVGGGDLAGLVQGAALHRQQRDGAAWFGEWLTLPQLVQLLARLQNQPPYANVERLSIAADQAVISGQLEPVDVSLEISIPYFRASTR